jgi:hypothetical protein
MVVFMESIKPAPHDVKLNSYPVTRECNTITNVLLPPPASKINQNYTPISKIAISIVFFREPHRTLPAAVPSGDQGITPPGFHPVQNANKEQYFNLIYRIIFTK